MEERALELGLSWREIASRAHIAYETLRDLRSGRHVPRPLTARNLDRALRWEPGSVQRILAGGELAPARQPSSPRERPAELRYADPERDAIAARVWEQNHDSQGEVFPVDVLQGVVRFLWQQRQRDTGATGARNGERTAAAGEH